MHARDIGLVAQGGFLPLKVPEQGFFQGLEDRLEPRRGLGMTQARVVGDAIGMGHKQRGHGVCQRRLAISSSPGSLGTDRPWPLFSVPRDGRSFMAAFLAGGWRLVPLAVAALMFASLGSARADE